MAVLTHLGRFLNIEGEGSPWLQPNVIPAVILEGRSPDRITGISLRLPRTPTAGLRRRPATPGFFSLCKPSLRTMSLH